MCEELNGKALNVEANGEDWKPWEVPAMAGVAPPALAPGAPKPQVVPPRQRQPEVVKPVLIGPPERKVAPQATCFQGIRLRLRNVHSMPFSVLYV